MRVRSHFQIRIFRSPHSLIRQGVRIGRVELLDDVMIRAVNQHAGFTYPLQPHLFFEFSGSAAEVQAQISAVQNISKDHKGGAFKFATEGTERDTLWRARKVCVVLSSGFVAASSSSVS